MVAESGRSEPTEDVSPHELRARIAQLEQLLAQREREVAAQREQTAALQRVIDHLPYALYWKDPALVYQGCNRRFAHDIDLAAPAAVVGLSDAELPWQADEVARFQAADRRILETQRVEYDDRETVIHPDGSQEWFETYKIPLVDAVGASVGVLATYNNITVRKRAEATIQAQAMLLQELATPVIPLTEQILILPLVGTVDSRRAQQVIAAVLDRLEASHAQTVIMDITGVPIIDTQVAHVFVQLDQSVRLLGARLMLTGMRPEVAQALVGLGVELRGMVTYSSLERAIGELAVLAPA